MRDGAYGAHLEREVDIICSLTHPNIIRIHEVFENREKIVMVMEFASGGELYDYVQQREELSETEARHFFRQIVSAVHYCHRNGVVHRDLKLENILLDHNRDVKLADFGLSNRYEKGRLLDTFCGSPLYASPEIINGLPYLGPEVDCWALGVLLYALVHGSMPFDGDGSNCLRQQISLGQYRRPPCPSDACPLIDWMLTVCVEDRATVEDIASHWWVNNGSDGPLPCSTSTSCTRCHEDMSLPAHRHDILECPPSNSQLQLNCPPYSPGRLMLCCRKETHPLDNSTQVCNLNSLATPQHHQPSKLPKKGILKTPPLELRVGARDDTSCYGDSIISRNDQEKVQVCRRTKSILKYNRKFTSDSKLPQSEAKPWSANIGHHKPTERNEASPEDELER